MKTSDKIKILIIEDDYDLIQLLHDYYNPRGFEVHGFSDPLIPLETLEQKTNPNDYDVALVDLNLPHMSGIDFIVKFKTLCPNTPILLMTGDTNLETVERAIEAGAYDYVVKPLHFQQLNLTLKRAVGLKKIQDENKVLRTAVDGKSSISNYIFKSSQMTKIMDIVKRVSDSSATVLIKGESGSGKEVIAKAIHNMGKYKDKPFIAINCSAIPENLLESELFGHAKGSFTGAFEKKIGLFEEAGDGILFLDEIGDLSLSLQAKLLRVLQDKKIKRVGENKYIDIHARVLTATHKDLKEEVQTGRFREDLYFRLNVIPIHVPPLRERKDDIMPLAQLFLRKFSQDNNKNLSFSKEALEHLSHLPWQGNVRELENVIERTVVLATTNHISISDLPQFEDISNSFYDHTSLFKPLLAKQNLPSLESILNSYVEFVVKHHNKTKEEAAAVLGIDRKTLYRRLQNLKAGREPTVSEIEH